MRVSREGDDESVVARTPEWCRGGVKMDADRTEGAEQAIEEPVKRTRRKRTAVEKRQIVQQALKRGAVLHEVARRHGIHPSLLYKWRRQYGSGPVAPKRAAPSRAMLLPVKVRRSTAPRG